MNVLTSQDVALIGCCPCQPDACEEPRKECQSISVNVALCGTHVTIPPFGSGWTALGCKQTTLFYTLLTRTITISKTGSPTYTRIITLEWAMTDGDCDYTYTDTYDPEAIIPGQGSILTTEVKTQGGNYFFSQVETGTGGTEEDPITYTKTQSFTFSGAIEDSETWLRNEGISQIEALSFADATGGSCSSEVIFGGMTDCEDIEPPIPTIATVTKARYRVGIPGGDRWEATTAEWLAWDAAGEEDEERGPEPPKTTQDAAHAAWVIAHAAWTAADPDERGEEPLEPTPRSTYELQWDEVFFPEEWEIWKAAKDAFDAATAAHEIWTECEEDCGDEPVIPDDPGAEPTAPSLVASRSWVYAAAEWSSWFEIAVPTQPGETRVVNMLVICYRSAALGQKPTAHGEVYEL